MSIICSITNAYTIFLLLFFLGFVAFRFFRISRLWILSSISFRSLFNSCIVSDLKCLFILGFLFFFTDFLGFLNESELIHFGVHLGLLKKLAFFIIQLIFATIYGSYCTFWYYSWASLYYFSYLLTLSIVLSAKSFQFQLNKLFLNRHLSWNLRIDHLILFFNMKSKL